jgi:hypothetical protein
MRATLLCCVALFVAAMPVCGQAVINEIRIDQTGTDNDEYFELFGAPATDLSALTYVVIGDGAVLLGSGVVESVTSLAGQSIPASGYFVVAEPTFTLGTADFTPTGTNPLNFENTDTVTHMLVTGWTGTLNTDLDTNDDGVLDVTPWTAVVDRIAVLAPSGSGSELGYGPPNVGPEPPSFTPGHVFRYPDGAANVLTSWNIGRFDPSGGQDTPGAANAPDSMPEALGGPQSLVVNAGPTYAGFIYVVAFTTSGTTPGIPISPFVTVPLNYDAVLQASLDMANGPIFTNNFGFLDANGQAFATLNIPPVMGAAGATVHGAAVVIDPSSGQAVLASNPVPLSITL